MEMSPAIWTLVKRNGWLVALAAATALALVVWKLTAEQVIAVFTIVLAISTIGLWLTTQRLGDRADDGMRVLERAYIYPILNQSSSTQLAATLDTMSSTGRADPLSLLFSLRNLGNTPGTVLEIQADLHLANHNWKPTKHFLTQPVLGRNEAAPDMHALVKLEPGQPAWLLTNKDVGAIGNLVFEGFIRYTDVFSQEQTSRFLWAFDSEAKRLVPIY